MQAFLQEEDENLFLGREPANTTGAYKQSSKIEVKGLVATKHVEREYYMVGTD